MTIPSLDVFKRAAAKVLFKVGSYPSLGEEPGKFFDSVLSVFMSGLIAETGVEGETAFVVIDVMPPMATSVQAKHQGHKLVNLHHVDSIAYFKALPNGLHKIMTMNHSAIVKL